METLDNDPSALFSHPKKLLQEHLRDVAQSALRIFQSKSISVPPELEKEQQLSLTLVREILLYACLFHDIGKATRYFQKYLFADKPRKNKYTNHARISALLGYYYFLEKYKNKWGAAFVYLIILKHHRNLESLEDSLAELFEHRAVVTFLEQITSIPAAAVAAIYKEWGISVDLNRLDEDLIRKTIDEIGESHSVILDSGGTNIYTYLLFNYLFSILIYSDKEDAIFKKEQAKIKSHVPLNQDGVKEYLNQIVSAAKQEVNTPINRARQDIFELTDGMTESLAYDNALLSLNTPTGSGKTLSSFNIALKLRAALGSHYKIIYILPFTSIIDQNYDVIQQVLKDPPNNVLLKHHYCSDIAYRVNNKERDYGESSFLTESWNAAVVVSTFYQFFHTLFSSQNRYLKKYHTFVNSIIIIDEIQAIPLKYYKLLNDVFVMLKDCFGVRFIISTATRPLIFQENCIKDIVDSQLLRRYREVFNRYKLIPHLEKTLSLEEFCDEFIHLIKRQDYKRIMIVANTIASSRKFLKLLINALGEEYEYIYLSTSVLPIHREERIERIKQSPGKPLIIVSTQLIEAGVDIDTDIIFRDFAPLDCVIQTAGRVNRNGKRAKGLVCIYRLGEDKKDYCRYIYDPLLLQETEPLLKDGSEIEENNLDEVIAKYYKRIQGRSSNDEAMKLLSYINEMDYQRIQEEFKLIDTYAKIDFFVELDERATAIKMKYEAIKEIDDPFKRKAEFAKIKNAFQNYVVSINISEEIADYERDTINFVSADYYDDTWGFEPQAPGNLYS